MAEAYALGALDPGERPAFETHLAGCADCARAVEEARVAVSQLAYLAPDAEPSKLLKARLVRRVRTEAQDAPVGSAARAAREVRTAGIPFWLWAGVAALLAITLYTAWDARNLQRELRDTNERAALELKHREQLEEQYLAARRAAMIFTDPKSVKIMLPPADKSMPALEVMWHDKLGLCVMGKDVPMPPENRTLQLWLIPKAPGSKPMPAGVLRPDENGHFMMLVSAPPDDMPDTKELAVTEEPAGGSPQPTSTPMWAGAVS
jgi:anti-sigma-K factor RskA